MLLFECGGGAGHRTVSENPDSDVLPYATFAVRARFYFPSTPLVPDVTRQSYITLTVEGERADHRVEFLCLEHLV